MTKRHPPSLGILGLERGVQNNSPTLPLPGSLSSPVTYDFPVVSETVTGAWVENVVRGDPTMEGPYIEAAQRLVDRGAVVITSNCGFSIRHQDAVAAAVKVPVVMSSLLLLPSLLRSVPTAAKIAVLTYDSAYCGQDLLGTEKREDLDRIVVAGIEGGVFWHNEMKKPPPPTAPADIESDVLARVQRLRQEVPEIGAILLECAGFPLTASALRVRERLPVYDITDLCRLTIASVRV